MITYTTTDEASVENGVKATIYGRSGVGKTLLSATAPKPVIISAENGLLSLSKRNQMRVFGKTVDIPVINIQSLEDLNVAYNDVSEPNDFATIILDSVTEIADVVLGEAKRRLNDGRAAYGETNDLMLKVLRDFRDLKGKHVIFIAQQEEMGSNALSTYGPAMPGKKLGNKVPYIFDEVFHMDIGTDDKGGKFRFLQTQPDLQFDAKDRSGALDVIEQPDLTVIINKIIHGK